MMEIKDPAIKLFGKTIPVAGEGDVAGAGDDSSSPRLSNASSNFSAEKELAEEEAMDTEPQTDHDPDEATQEESGDPPAAQETDDDHPQKMAAGESDKDSPESQKDDDEKDSSNDPKNPQQKTIKKPDKILPCPRCNSMDTKFCYYNNYNINQPRHFCKSCQRYWTAGGTMRNVPVGAGRRKNKSSSAAASRYCHITVSEALQAANGAHHHLHGHHHPNGTVLTFGAENPLCESMVPVLNIADKKVVRNGITTAPRNGFKENDDRSSGSTVTTTSSMDDGVKRAPQEPPPMKQSLNGFPTPTTATTTTTTAVAPQMPCFQWPYMWNPAAAVPMPPFCPVPFYPAPYWNGAAAIPWNIPWVGPTCPPGQTSPGSNPNSPTLGKHSRDGEILDNSEKGSGAPTVLVPKTLRIDDPDEAAKSSIWTTLGIKKEKGNFATTTTTTATTTPTSKGATGFFNTLHKGEDKDHKKEGSPALMKANPAALCRSISFQESA